jgi:hypothetical protein
MGDDGKVAERFRSSLLLLMPLLDGIPPIDDDGRVVGIAANEVLVEGGLVVVEGLDDDLNRREKNDGLSLAFLTFSFLLSLVTPTERHNTTQTVWVGVEELNTTATKWGAIQSM